jgi:hypothetical protein
VQEPVVMEDHRMAGKLMLIRVIQDLDHRPAINEVEGTEDINLTFLFILFFSEERKRSKYILQLCGNNLVAHIFKHKYDFFKRPMNI